MTLAYFYYSARQFIDDYDVKNECDDSNETMNSVVLFLTVI